MFLENPVNRKTFSGWIEVVTGSMFSGKTEELIRRLKRAKIAKMRVEIFKPVIDTRYAKEKVVSHDANEIHSTPIANSSEIMPLLGDIDVVGIDEVQFFDDGIIDVCNELASRGIRVVVAGLDTDFRGKPFGPMPALLACAEYITKVHAICMRCGNLANHSHRITEAESLVVLGEKESYEPLCRSCFVKANAPKELEVNEASQE